MTSSSSLPLINDEYFGNSGSGGGGGTGGGGGGGSSSSSSNTNGHINTYNHNQMSGHHLLSPNNGNNNPNNGNPLLIANNNNNNHHQHQHQHQPIPVTTTTTTLTQPVNPTPLTTPASQLTSSSSSPSLTTPIPSIPTTTPSTTLPMPKSVYDSLAPLDVPSKPVIYIDEKSASSSETTATLGDGTETKKTVDGGGDDSTSSRDEKAKLESILLGKMMDGTAAGMRMDGSAGPAGATGGGTTSFHHITNRFLGGKWPRTNTPAVILANRPLPPNYVCTNCKKPGHHKQLCPEPVSFLFFVILLD